MPRNSYTSLPPPLPKLPRCEAWRPVRNGKPAGQCENGAVFVRDGHRVCMAHKRADRVAFVDDDALEVTDSDVLDVKRRRKSEVC